MEWGSETHQEQCDIVEHKEGLEDLVQVMEPLHIVEVLTDVEQVQEFADVPIPLDVQDESLTGLPLVER